MPRSLLWKGLSMVGLVLAPLLLPPRLAQAAAEVPTISAETARAFVNTGRRVEIAPGRQLNIVCMGQGSRTVLLDAGGSDWSLVWARVLPLVAARTRACAYDRAGLGQSDPGPSPRTPSAIAEDLHALIDKAGLGPGLVLVGHSLGGFHVKLHAALYPDDVAGLVLVDPSEERPWDRTRGRMRARFGPALSAQAELADAAWISRLLDRYRGCEVNAKAQDLDPKSDLYRRCTDPVRPVLGPEIAAERERIQATRRYQVAQASEILFSVYGDARGDPVYAQLFKPGVLGDKPVIVLSHDAEPSQDPIDQLGEVQIAALHTESARLSRRGVRKVVPKTTHHIELDAPDAIAQAVDEVLARSR